MSHHILEYDQECKSCSGTGLYVGMAERDGAAVVCVNCNGTGCSHTKIEYDDFDGIKLRKGIKRVYQVNPGISIGVGVSKDKGREFKLSDFGGKTYDSWVKDKKFSVGSEMREFCCPAWWFQSCDYKKKPAWNDG